MNSSTISAFSDEQLQTVFEDSRFTSVHRETNDTMHRPHSKISEELKVETNPLPTVQAQVSKCISTTANGIRRTLSSALIKPLPIFTHATEYGGIIYISCIQGLDRVTGIAPSDVTAEVYQMFENLATVLLDAGSDFSRVLKMTLFFVNMRDDFLIVNDIINKYFPEGSSPARSSIEVKNLPRNCKVVVECVAAKK